MLSLNLRIQVWLHAREAQMMHILVHVYCGSVQMLTCSSAHRMHRMCAGL